MTDNFNGFVSQPVNKPTPEQLIPKPVEISKPIDKFWKKMGIGSMICLGIIVLVIAIYGFLLATGNPILKHSLICGNTTVSVAPTNCPTLPTIPACPACPACPPINVTQYITVFATNLTNHS